MSRRSVPEKRWPTKVWPTMVPIEKATRRRGCGEETAEYLGVVGGDGPGDVKPGEREGGGEQNGYVPELERGQEVELEDADGISDEFEEAAGREGATARSGPESLGSGIGSCRSLSRPCPFVRPR